MRQMHVHIRMCIARTWSSRVLPWYCLGSLQVRLERLSAAVDTTDGMLLEELDGAGDYSLASRRRSSLSEARWNLMSHE